MKVYLLVTVELSDSTTLLVEPKPACNELGVLIGNYFEAHTKGPVPAVQVQASPYYANTFRADERG